MLTAQACFIHCSPECAAFAKRLPEKWSKPAVPDPEPQPPPVVVLAEEPDDEQARGQRGCSRSQNQIAGLHAELRPWRVLTTYVINRDRNPRPCRSRNGLNQCIMKGSQGCLVFSLLHEAGTAWATAWYDASDADREPDPALTQPMV